MSRRTSQRAAQSDAHTDTVTTTTATAAPTVAPDILTQAEVTERLRVSERTLRHWTTKRLIPAIKPPGGRRVLYYWPDLVAALRRMGNPTR